MATDYKTECGSVPLSFIQMLASSIVGYHDLAGVMHYRINGLETAGNCSGLTDPLTCDLSHIEEERRLVEETFVIDNCGRLAWKVFSNSDNDWTDYGDCGELPQSFIRMLSRTIRTDALVNRINAVIDNDVCTSLEPLLDCVTNQIQAETLLVNNLFATDDCGNLLIKLFGNTSTMTDYSVECGQLGATFYELLARCIVKYDGHYYLNTAAVTGYCDSLHDFWTCGLNHISPEDALVQNVFAVDSCGNLALKIFNNDGETRT